MKEYGWLHSCGTLYYQLDSPEVCWICTEKGTWNWHDEKDDSNRLAGENSVHCKNNPKTRPEPSLLDCGEDQASQGKRTKKGGEKC